MLYFARVILTGSAGPSPVPRNVLVRDRNSARDGVPRRGVQPYVCTRPSAFVELLAWEDLLLASELRPRPCKLDQHHRVDVDLHYRATWLHVKISHAHPCPPSPGSIVDSGPIHVLDVAFVHWHYIP